MPSPVGHALGGLIVGLSLLPLGTRRTLRTLRTVGAVVAAAVSPDADFFWGRHNMETHSFGAAVLAGLAVLAWTRGKHPRLALAVTLAWSSHVLFDWLGSDDTPPLGVMALWPLSSEFHFANAFIFEAISRRYWLDNFMTHNAWAVTKELVLLGPLAAIAWWVRRRGATDENRPPISHRFDADSDSPKST